MSSTVSGASSAIELLPQVRTARAAADRQAIGIAVTAKSLQVQAVQGDAVLQMLEQVSQTLTSPDGVGGQLDVHR